MFIVFKLPRSGSTMFGSVLNSHPDIVCRSEILNELAEQNNNAITDFLIRFYSGDQDEADSDAIRGATLNPFKHGRSFALKRIFDAIADSRPAEHLRVLVLDRRNKLNQAVSAYLARDRSSWQSSLHKLEDRSVLAKTSFDLDRLTSIVVHLEHQAQQLREIARDLSDQVMHVTYESLDSSAKEAIGPVFAFLGAAQLGNEFDYTAGFQKILPHDLRDVVSNYDHMLEIDDLQKYLRDISGEDDGGTSDRRR